jgi:alpha-1,2-mannosyltransferase
VRQRLERHSGRLHASLTYAMALFLLLNALVLNGALWFFSPEGYKEVVLQHSVAVLRGDGLDDSWGIMSEALDYAQTPHTSLPPLYSEIFFNRHVKFQYPPTALLAISAMRLVDPDRVRTNEFYAGPWPTLDVTTSWIFLGLMALATAAVLELRLRELYPTEPWRNTTVLRGIIVAAFTLTFYPVVKAFTLGQIQVWINGLFALALLAWMLGWKASSGVAIGLICLIKPHYGLFLVWAAIRGEWRFVIGCVSAGCVGLVASLAAFGLADHLDYLSVLLYMFQRGETFYPNQSVNGLLNRLMSIRQPDLYGNLEFFIERYAPFNVWIYGLTVASSLAILAAAMVPRQREGGDRVLDFCIMGLSTTAASPIAWEHHYGILLPIFFALLPGTLRDRRQLILLIGSYVLASNFLPATQLLAGSILNVVQSYLLAAVLAILWLLYRQRTPEGARVESFADAIPQAEASSRT